MGFSYSSNSVEDLKSQVNIVDVIGRVVPLKRAGSNYKGICPFHNEKTPSFVVSDQKQIFTCFGCGAKGDVIEFVKRYYNLDFAEAMEKIADEYGIKLEKLQYGEDRTKYYDINKEAAKFFYDNFTKTKNKGYSYMKGRGISDGILKKFGIGYADDSWDSLYKHLTDLGKSAEDLLELGLISEKDGHYYDKFRDRVMFPIINTSGKVIGFGGRAIGDAMPKYLNSSESKVFMKKNNLYGLNITKGDVAKQAYIILVEGYMDVIGLYQSGVTNVSASLGTALTDNQAKLIKRYTENVVLSYDADGAGRAAASRGLDILSKEDLNVKVLHVSQGKDPDEFVKLNGKNAFLQLVEGALPLIDYKLETAKAGCNINNDTGKIDYMKKAILILNSLSPVESDVYIKKLAKDLKVSEGAIRLEMGDGRQSAINNNKRVISGKDNANNRDEITGLEKNILKIIFTNCDLILKVREYRDMFTSDFCNKIFDLSLEQYEENNQLEYSSIVDNLEPTESLLLKDILDGIVLGGREEEILEESINKWRITKLEEQEKEIITMLSIADENENQSSIQQLTLKLKSILEEKKKISGGNN